MAAGTILIVDDNPTNMKLVSFILERHGHGVRTACGPREALRALAEEPLPALILMDLQMPELDGFELTRQLKADPRTAAIPVIAVTAYAMKGDEERALAAGCDGYLSKPIDTRALPGVIARFLGQPPA